MPAQAAFETMKTIPNPSPAAGDKFAFSIVSMGDDVLIGAPGDDTSGPNAGTVYLFDGHAGELDRVISNPEPSVSHAFGRALAAVGNEIAVAAALRSDNSGIVYLLDEGPGQDLKIFQKPAGSTANCVSFGSSLAAFGDDLLVGCPGFWNTEGNIGAVYLFDGSTGNLIREFRSEFSDDNFGQSILVAGNNIFIGAPLQGPNNSGVVYQFDGTTGELLRKFVHPDPFSCSNWCNFGWSMAVSEKIFS